MDIHSCQAALVSRIYIGWKGRSITYGKKWVISKAEGGLEGRTDTS